MTKSKYVIVDPAFADAYYKDGYKVITSFHETIIGYEDCYGTMMNNSFSLRVPTSKSIPKLLMELTTAGELLYGEKRENNS